MGRKRHDGDSGLKIGWVCSSILSGVHRAPNARRVVENFQRGVQETVQGRLYGPVPLREATDGPTRQKRKPTGVFRQVTGASLEDYV